MIFFIHSFNLFLSKNSQLAGFPFPQVLQLQAQSPVLVTLLLPPGGKCNTPDIILWFFCIINQQNKQWKSNWGFFSTKKKKNKLGSQTIRDKQFTTLMEEIQPSLLWQAPDRWVWWWRGSGRGKSCPVTNIRYKHFFHPLSIPLWAPVLAWLKEEVKKGSNNSQGSSNTFEPWVLRWNTSMALKLPHKEGFVRWTKVMES